MLKIGEIFFKFRDYTPIPIVIYMIYFANLTQQSLIIGTISVLLGEWVRIKGVAYIGGVSRTRTFSTGQKLITGGPFSRVRNPLYIGNFFLSVGCIITANAGYYFLAGSVAYFFIQYSFIINWEENNLRKIFGEDFKRYCGEVPRWIPKIIPANTDDATIAGDYGTSIRSEKSTILAVIVLYLLLFWRSGWFIQAVELITS